MLPYVKSLLFDEGAFLGGLRTTFVVAGLGLESGQFPTPEWLPAWAGLVLVGGGMMMRSSIKKQQPVK